MAKLEQTINFVNFTRRNRMKPIVSSFAREDHQTVRLKVQVNLIITWVFKVHSSTAFETERYKDFFEWGVSVYMGWNAMTWHVIICSALVKQPELTQHRLPRLRLTSVFVVTDFLNEISIIKR